MDSEPNPGTSSVSTTTSSTTTTTITTSSSRMQQPQISVYSGSDRHAVQVIQQALHRPPSSAAQYLQQMYAAQQQHLMLHTAALQQQHLSSSQLQSLAAVQTHCKDLIILGKFVQWKTTYIPHRKCHTTVKYVPDIYQPLYFSYTCTVNKPFPGFQFYQWQYYPTDYVTREYLPYPNGKPSSNVSPSSNASYPPIQPHPLIKHQQIPLHSPPPKVSHHQLILQQQQQQIQPITLQNPTQDPPPSQHCIPLQNHGLPPAPSSAQSQHCSPIQSHPPPLTMSPSQSQSAQQSVVVSPPPPHSPSQQIVSPTSHQQYSTLQSSPIPIATPPQMSTSPPAQIPSLPLQSMQSLQVQPEILSQGQVLVQNALVSEEELPAAEALVQLPFQTLPPPQTVAVNLQVQPPAPVDPPVVYQVEDVCEEEMPEESDECVRMDRTPPPPTLSPAAITVGRGEDLTSEHPLLAATTRNNSTSMPSSIPNVENKPPQAIVKPQILTHVIEGFVIQEGLEPFPVSRSSLLIEQPVKKRPILDNQVINSVCVQPELQNNAKHADNSSDTEMEDMIAEETLEEMDSELLKCEFCGKMGYANEFLRSKRFCTMSCAKRYNVSCSKKFALSRWNRKPDNQSLGHRGRRPSGPDGAARDHILRQLPITYPSAEEDLASHEDSVPSAMTTRLRRQSERERERCQDIADEFRAQEIDGQALLLLKEDHLMSAMNIKLGPALKICARINSLKES
ncbi:polyhomeotic 3-like protein [Camelus ferus]|nr:polyhomeotic 3-like protein [Camelus ferus]